MLNGVGFVLILGCVFSSFLLSGGKLEIILHALPHKLMAIVGAALGAFIVSNPLPTTKLAGKGLLGSFKGSRWKETDYRDLLTLLFGLLTTFKKGGATAIEPHLDVAAKSRLFMPYPRRAGFPGVHTMAENALRMAARSALSTYNDMQEIVRLGACKNGSNHEVDHAIRTAPQIEALLGQGKQDRGAIAESFDRRAAILRDDDENAV
jgi:flagellar motor component MotA